MTASKRKDWSLDDLMRMQEEPHRKRARTAPVSEFEARTSVEASDEEFVDEVEVEVSDNGRETEESDEEEDGEKDGEEEEEDGDGDEEDEEEGPVTLDGNMDASQDVGARQAHRTSLDDDALSRFSFKTRAEPFTKKPVLSASTKPVYTTFASMEISPILQSALNRMSIKLPTEIQAACIPPLLAGRDCIGNAKTGSGKTIAFALPILQRLLVDPYGIFALVLTPTRELAFQIAEQFAVLGSPLNVRTAVVVGGMDMMAQALELGNRPHVVVATPGRIVDHLKSSSGEWDLSRVKFLVLDEADRLLTSTFSTELAYLFGVVPRERQTCLFTATWTPAVEKIGEASPRPGKQKPFIHKMTASIETVETLKQSYILVPSHIREAYLYHLLCNPPESIIHLRRAPPEPIKRGKTTSKPKSKKGQKKPTTDDESPEQPPPTIIFCNRPRTAAYLTELLQQLSIRSAALHSRLTQRERLNSLSLFRSCVVPVLISTDVGSRGLDIEEVAQVINWDLPAEPEEYTHRVGRTARAGRAGLAVSFVTERDEEKILKIEERIHTTLEEMVLPENKVLEKLNAVSTAKRIANMELHDSKFGRREEIHKLKQGRVAS